MSDIKELFEVLLGEFHDRIEKIGNLIHRDARFATAENKIKVAMGMRRSGKTYFLFQKILSLLEDGIPLTRILYLNVEDDRLLPLTGEKFASLIDAFYSKWPENHDHRCQLFFDEIQNVDGWATVCRRLHDTKNADIFLTGSSAKLLSKEIATNLRGRSLATEIWPFSFAEYLKAKQVNIKREIFGNKEKDILTKNFLQYLQEGGFPELTKYTTEDRITTLQDYVDIVTYRDIVERHNITNTSSIKYMITSLLQNTSCSFSINKFFNDLKSQGYKVSRESLHNYAEHIEDAYLAFFVPLFASSPRKAQANPKKTYAVDPGLVKAISLRTQSDLGKLFENVIFLDLKRNNCTVNYYLTKERYEIDFVVQTKEKEKFLLQAVWDSSDPATLEREKRALISAEQELGINGHLITLQDYLHSGILPLMHN